MQTLIQYKSQKRLGEMGQVWRFVIKQKEWILFLFTRLKYLFFHKQITMKYGDISECELEVNSISAVNDHS
jgi:hypothetical protein